MSSQQLREQRQDKLKMRYKVIISYSRDGSCATPEYQVLAISSITDLAGLQHHFSEDMICSVIILNIEDANMRSVAEKLEGLAGAVNAVLHAKPS